MSNPLGIEPADVFLQKSYVTPKWVWEGQLAEGCVTLLTGQPKAGKSTFLKNLIKAVCDGNDFLNIPTNQCGVLYLALEEHEAFLAKHLKDLNITHQGVHIKIGSIFCSDDERFKALEEYCREFQIKLIAIDPLIKFLNIDDTNDYPKVYKAMGKLSDLARRLDAHIVGVHHSNKGNSDSPTQILGSNAFFGSCDGALFISRSDNSGCIKSNLRYGDSLDKAFFTYDEKQRLIFKGNQHEVKTNDLKNEILIYVQEKGDAMIEPLRKHLGTNDQQLRDTLKQMVREGLLIESGTGRRGDPFLYSPPLTSILNTEERLGGGNAKN